MRPRKARASASHHGLLCALRPLLRLSFFSRALPRVRFEQGRELRQKLFCRAHGNTPFRELGLGR